MFYRPFLLILVLAFWNGLASQISHVDEAIILSQNGQHQEAENILMEMENTGDSVGRPFLLTRAYNYSWWKKHTEAEQWFKKVIVECGDDYDAFVGLAFNSTWSGRHANALQYYQKALSIVPDSKSAMYGLAHHYLIMKNPDGLQFTLGNISRQFDPDAEYFYLLGKLEALKLNHYKARKAFKKSLSMNPDYEVVRNHLSAYESAPRKYSLSAWYGTSSMGEGRIHNLRRIDLSFSPNDKLLFYAGFDNSLIMQNLFLSTTEVNAPYVFGGAKYGITSKYHAKIEAGIRYFKTLPDQLLISLENIYFLNEYIVLTSLHLLDDRGNELFITNGITADVKINASFRTAVSYFRSDNLNNLNVNNQRLMIVPKFSYQNLEASVGGYYDWIKMEEFSDSRPLGFFALISFPIIGRLDGKLLYQLEDGFFNQNSNLFSAGLTIKL